MSRYDDDRVIALLRESVPPVPDGHDRIVAIRDRAGRQRVMLWSQTLGAVVAVLLVVGVAAAFTTPSGGRIEPTGEPMEALIDALGKQSSVRFEARMELDQDDVDVPGVRDEIVREMVASHVTGAVTRDGDIQVDGDTSFFMTGAFGLEPDAMSDSHYRLVDGRMYRSIAPGEGDDVPPGKTWVLENDMPDEDPPAFKHLERQLRLAAAILDDVRYVGQDVVRGARVAEYEAKVPVRLTGGMAVTIRFALDRDDLPRRIETSFSFTGLMGFGGSYEGFEEHSAQPAPPGLRPAPPTQRPRRADPLNVVVSAEFFGYGDDVDIKAPPADQVATFDELYESDGSGSYEFELQTCVEQAESHEATKACYDEAGFSSSRTPPSPPSAPPGSTQLGRSCEEDEDEASCEAPPWGGIPAETSAPRREPATASPPP